MSHTVLLSLILSWPCRLPQSLPFFLQWTQPLPFHALSLVSHGNSSVWLWAQVVQELTCFLHRLALMHKDYAVVLCCLGAREALSKVLDKHPAQLLLASELRHLVAECEKYAQLNSNLTSSILAGCIQVRRVWWKVQSREENRKQGVSVPGIPCGSSGRSGHASLSCLPTPHGPIRIW